MPQSERYRPPRALSPKTRLFLTALARVGQIARACMIARVSRRLPFAWRKTDPKFAAAMAEAKSRAEAFLEDQVDRRAIEAVNPELVFDHYAAGQINYNLGQLTAELRRVLPEKYGDAARGQDRLAG